MARQLDSAILFQTLKRDAQHSEYLRDEFEDSDTHNFWLQLCSEAVGAVGEVAELPATITNLCIGRILILEHVRDNGLLEMYARAIPNGGEDYHVLLERAQKRIQGLLLEIFLLQLIGERVDQGKMNEQVVLQKSSFGARSKLIIPMLRRRPRPTVADVFHACPNVFITFFPASTNPQ